MTMKCVLNKCFTLTFALYVRESPLFSQHDNTRMIITY